MPRSAAVLAVLCLGWAANPDSPGQPSVPENVPLLVVPGESVGPLSIGMSRAEAKAIYGPFETHGAGAPSTTVQYPTLGLDVMFGDDGLSAVFGGNCCPPYKSAVDAFKGRTADGLGMGSTRADVVAVFGEPSRPDVDGDTEALDYRERGISFVLWRGTVNLLFIRTPVPAR